MRGGSDVRGGDPSGSGTGAGPYGTTERTVTTVTVVIAA